MSPLLAQTLYQQIKRVISRPIALADPQGQPFKQTNDFKKDKRFSVNEAITQDKNTVSVADRPKLRAIPLFQQSKLFGLLVLELAEEDIQTIQVVTSLAELIIAQFIDTHKPKPDAVDLLMTRLVFRPQTIDQDELEQQMAALGFRLDVQRTGVVFKLVGFWENYLQSVGAPLGDKKNLITAKKNDIEQTLKSFFSKNQDNIIGYIGNDCFLVLKDLSTTDYDRFCNLLKTHFGEITNSLKNIYVKEIKVGVSPPVNSSFELIASAQEALQILEVGEKIYSDRKVFRRSDLGIMPLLLSDNLVAKKSLASEILEHLTDAELLETLQAFLVSNLNLTQTAEQLKIHRNTVIYRLDKITELLNRDPRVFDQAVELHIALRFRRVFPDSAKTIISS